MKRRWMNWIVEVDAAEVVLPKVEKDRGAKAA